MSRRFAIVLVVVSLFRGFTGCGSSTAENDLGQEYSKEHIMLLGEWQEHVTNDSSVYWKFSLVDMTCGSFTHHYKLENQTIRVSGMEYVILNQGEDTISIKAPDQSIVELIRLGERKKLPQTE